jgi:DNA invertase Pin-like site-specific DNA recombinase
MRFAIYARKSVYSDKSDSVKNQIRMCREYISITHDSDNSFKEYSDEGFTGANTDRPGLALMLDDIKAGEIDAVVIYQLDRLSRDVRDFSNIYALMEENNVKFISVKESVDTNTPIGRAMTMITMVFAQMERETIAARVTDNMIGLAKKGYWTGGNPPYGYVREQIMVDGKKHVTIVPDPEAARYVESIFDTFLENGYSLQGMETAFKQQGIRTVTGAFFSSTQLHKILTMPFCAPATKAVRDYYISQGCRVEGSEEEWDGSHGVMIYGRSTQKNKKHQLQPRSEWVVCPGAHKPFLPEEKWLAAQEQFRKNTFEKKQKYDIPLLKGTLRCAKCGGLMQVSRKKKKAGVTSHYYCLKRMRQGPAACPMRMVKCDLLDQEAVGIFRRIQADPSTIRKIPTAS